MSTIAVGNKVQWTSQAGNQLEGIVDRIVKCSAPCVTSENPADWTLHVKCTVNVTSDSEKARIGDIYQVKYNTAKGM